MLDMGAPIRIVDLAHDLTEVSGLVPGREIQIVFAGLRPGEKLVEELFPVSERSARPGEVLDVDVAPVYTSLY